MRWLTKTMTKNNRVGKAFFYPFFCALAWVGYYAITYLSNIYFLPLLSSSMYQGGVSMYQGKAIRYQGSVIMCYYLISKAYY